MAEKKVSEEHQFLYHYTTWDALKGMLDTNEIWATHVRNLNDETEYLLAQNFIENRLVPHIKKWLEGAIQSQSEVGRLVEEHGGLEHQALELAKSAIEAMYKVTGNDFFVSSFCGNPSNKYQEMNGLLSQWRGYGNKQGLLLKFETEALEAMMNRNVEHLSPDMMFLADVFYSDNEERIETELAADLKQLEAFVIAANDSIITGGPRPNGQAAMQSFVKVATRVKHLAFKEENEVRLVAWVMNRTPDLKKRISKRNVTLNTPKEIMLRSHQLGPIPFIKLFGREFPPLPIRKIIVGPSRNKVTVAEALEKGLRGRNIEIAVSDIPYV